MPQVPVTIGGLVVAVVDVVVLEVPVDVVVLEVPVDVVILEVPVVVVLLDVVLVVFTVVDVGVAEPGKLEAYQND